MGLAGVAASFAAGFRSAFLGVLLSPPFGVVGDIKEDDDVEGARAAALSVCMLITLETTTSRGDFAESLAIGFCLAGAGLGVDVFNVARKLGGGSIDSIS